MGGISPTCVKSRCPGQIASVPSRRKDVTSAVLDSWRPTAVRQPYRNALAAVRICRRRWHHTSKQQHVLLGICRPLRRPHIQSPLAVGCTLVVPMADGNASAVAYWPDVSNITRNPVRAVLALESAEDCPLAILECQVRLLSAHALRSHPT